MAGADASPPVTLTVLNRTVRAWTLRRGGRDVSVAADVDAVLARRDDRAADAPARALRLVAACARSHLDRFSHVRFVVTQPRQRCPCAGGPHPARRCDAAGHQPSSARFRVASPEAGADRVGSVNRDQLDGKELRARPTETRGLAAGAAALILARPPTRRSRRSTWVCRPRISRSSSRRPTRRTRSTTSRTRSPSMWATPSSSCRRRSTTSTSRRRASSRRPARARARPLITAPTTPAGQPFWFERLTAERQVQPGDRAAEPERRLQPDQGAGQESRSRRPTPARRQILSDIPFNAGPAVAAGEVHQGRHATPTTATCTSA